LPSRVEKKRWCFEASTSNLTIKPASFFGYRREMLAGLPVLVADEAKAILDSLSLPQYAGGVAGIYQRFPPGSFPRRNYLNAHPRPNSTPGTVAWNWRPGAGM
jgi:hypothetical protein